MKKFLLWLIAFISVVGVLYFSINISLKTYFNNSFYYTPNLIGMNIEDIKLLTKNSPIRIEEVSKEFSKEPEGIIFMQEPDSKEIIKKNRVIKIWVSKGSNDIGVPNVVGLNYIDAKSIIESKGFKVGEILAVTVDSPMDEVISTEPAPDTLLLSSEKVNLLVNKNSEVSKVEMPDLIGLSLSEATTILKDSSLILGTIKYENYESIEPNIVIETSVEYKAELTTGSTVNFIVSK